MASVKSDTASNTPVRSSNTSSSLEIQPIQIDINGDRAKRKSELMESVRADKDLVAKIEDELRLVYEAVELGHSISKDIWNQPDKSRKFNRYGYNDGISM